jgi:hypothetical protein
MTIKMNVEMGDPYSESEEYGFAADYAEWNQLINKLVISWGITRKFVIADDILPASQAIYRSRLIEIRDQLLNIPPSDYADYDPILIEEVALRKIKPENFREIHNEIFNLIKELRSAAIKYIGDDIIDVFVSKDYNPIIGCIDTNHGSAVILSEDEVSGVKKLMTGQVAKIGTDIFEISNHRGLTREDIPATIAGKYLYAVRNELFFDGTIRYIVILADPKKPTIVTNKLK